MISPKSGLPEEYKPMTMAMESSGLAVTGETKQLLEVGSILNKTAFAGRKSIPPRQRKAAAEERSAEQPKGSKCKRYSKYGHIARECRAKKVAAFCTALATDGGVASDSWFFFIQTLIIIWIRTYWSIVITGWQAVWSWRPTKER